MKSHNNKNRDNKITWEFHDNKISDDNSNRFLSVGELLAVWTSLLMIMQIALLETHYLKL